MASRGQVCFENLQIYVDDGWLCGYFDFCISSSRAPNAVGHVSDFPIPKSQWCFYDIACFA